MDGNKPSGTFTTIFQSLIPNSSPQQPMGERKYLDDNTRDSNLFSATLRGVNHNLSSHGNTDLSNEKANKYIELHKRIEGGESVSTGFLEASKGWMTGKGKDFNLAGGLMNFAGFIASGPQSKHDYMFGRQQDGNSKEKK